MYTFFPSAFKRVAISRIAVDFPPRDVGEGARVAARALAPLAELEAFLYRSLRRHERASATNLKRVWANHGLSRDWFDSEQGEGRGFLRQATEVKNVWIPYGE